MTKSAIHLLILFIVITGLIGLCAVMVNDVDSPLNADQRIAAMQKKLADSGYYTKRNKHVAELEANTVLPGTSVPVYVQTNNSELVVTIKLPHGLSLRLNINP